MAKPIVVKCVYCKKEIEKDSAFKVGSKSYYCSEGHYKAHEETKNIKRNINYKPQKGTERRDLTDYIQQLYLENGYSKNRIPWKMLMAQIKNILEDNETWHYYTVEYILKYMHDILGINLFAPESNGSILSLVQFYGIEAEEYFNSTEKIKQEVEKFNFDETRVVKNTNKNKCERFKRLSFD